MKILSIIAQLPMRTGSGVYFSNVIDRLKGYGHVQRALFAVQDQVPFDILNPDEQFPVEFKSEELPFPVAGMSDVMPYDHTVYSDMDANMMRLWMDAFRKRLIRAKEEFKPDIVILHHLWYLTSLAAEIFGSDVVKIGICHNTDLRQAEKNPRLKGAYVTHILDLDAIITLDESQKDKIAEVYRYPAERMFAIGGGFDEKIFYPLQDKVGNKTIQIAFSGKIDRSKGIFELVKAFHKVCGKKQNVHLNVIGIPDRENGRRLDELIGEAENITIIPVNNQRVLADTLRGMDIFVMPSYFEGLGLIALESLACGLFTVATEIDALMELLGDVINDSGVIEYVKLPRIYDVDKPVEEDLPEFVDRLSERLLVQIGKIERGESFPGVVEREIQKCSWGDIIGEMNDIISRVVGW